MCILLLLLLLLRMLLLLLLLLLLLSFSVHTYHNPTELNHRVKCVCCFHSTLLGLHSRFGDKAVKIPSIFVSLNGPAALKGLKPGCFLL